MGFLGASTAPASLTGSVLTTTVWGVAQATATRGIRSRRMGPQTYSLSPSGERGGGGLARDVTEGRLEGARRGGGGEKRKRGRAGGPPHTPPPPWGGGGGEGACQGCHRRSP